MIIIGGGPIACETADFLASIGKGVTLVFPEAAPLTLEFVDLTIKNVLLQRLAEEPVETVGGVRKFEQITAMGMSLVDRDGKSRFLAANSVVFATGARPDHTLAQSLKGKVTELYEVGDCVEARRIYDAVQEGAQAAFKI